MRLVSQIVNGELCAHSKALVSCAWRFLKHTHWCLTLAKKGREREKLASFTI